jgi:hypothetical protein
MHLLPHNKKKYLFLFLMLFTLTCYGQQKVFYLTKDFGAKGDGKTDCYTAFIKAASKLSNTKNCTLIINKGVYFINQYIGAVGTKSAAIDVSFKNCNGLTILGNNAKIILNGNFTRTADYQIPNVSFYYSYKQTVIPFNFINCKNLLFKDVELNGGVAQMRKESVAEGNSYGVFINDENEQDTSQNITLKNITAHHFATDGFLIKANGTNINMVNCTASNNARQGLSIVKGRNININYCNFDSTGKTGQYGWHAPGAGIDIENEFGQGKLTNVTIKNCNFRGNTGFQIVTTLSSENIKIDSCFFSDKTKGYSGGLNGIGLYSKNSSLKNSIIYGEIQVDLADQIYKEKPTQVFANNIIYSGTRAITSADFGRPVDFFNNYLVMLPNPDCTTYFPYIQNQNCRFNNNVVVFHADRIKKEPNLVNALIQWSIETKNNFFLMHGYSKTKSYSPDDYYYLALTNSQTIGRFYYPANQKMIATRNDGNNILTDAQLSKILLPGLLNSKLNAFDKKLLQSLQQVNTFCNTIIAKP